MSLQLIRLRSAFPNVEVLTRSHRDLLKDSAQETFIVTIAASHSPFLKELEPAGKFSAFREVTLTEVFATRKLSDTSLAWVPGLGSQEQKQLGLMLGSWEVVLF